MENFVSRTVADLKPVDAELDVEAAQERARAYVAETVRAGPMELHNVAALTGGIVAQEVIKILTKQYVPMDNTCVYDGVRSKTAVWRL